VSQIYVCDSISHCPDEDDEYLCDMNTCPPECSCIGASVDCRGGNLTNPPQSIGLKVFFGDHNNIGISKDTFRKYELLIRLSLANNSVATLPHGSSGGFTKLASLSELVLSDNKISYIGSNTFGGLSQLQHLFLFGNPISHIDGYAFVGLHQLQILNLSHLIISNFSRKAFLDLQSLKNLNLSHNMLVHMDGEAFKVLKSSLEKLDLSDNDFHFGDSFEVVPIFDVLQYIGSDRWHCCCLARQVVSCPAHRESPSCTNLLSPGMKSVIWIVIGIDIVTNAMVLLYRLAIITKKLTSNNIVLINLAASDFLIIIYLGGVAVADATFRGDYVRYDEDWISGGTCKFLGLSQMISLEMSLVTFNILNILYIYVLGYKKHTGDVNVRRVLGICSLPWCFVLAFGLTQMFLTDHIRSGMCMFLQGTNSAWYFNLMVFIIDTILHVVSVLSGFKLFQIIHSNAKALKNLGQVSKTKSSTKSFFVICTISNLLCRMPYDVCLLVSLAGIEIEHQAAAWMAIMVFPLNSLTNPFIHTLRGVILQLRRTKNTTNHPKH